MFLLFSVTVSFFIVKEMKETKELLWSPIWGVEQNSAKIPRFLRVPWKFQVF